MTPDDCVMEGSEFCTLDLLQHWGPQLRDHEAAGGSGSSVSRSGTAHLPCPQCTKWSLCSDGPDRSNVRLVPTERGVLFVLPFGLKCNSCNGACWEGPWHFKSGAMHCSSAPYISARQQAMYCCLLCMPRTN